MKTLKKNSIFIICLISSIIILWLLCKCKVLTITNIFNLSELIGFYINITILYVVWSFLQSKYDSKKYIKERLINIFEKLLVDINDFQKNIREGNFNSIEQKNIRKTLNDLSYEIQNNKKLLRIYDFYSENKDNVDNIKNSFMQLKKLLTWDEFDECYFNKKIIDKSSELFNELIINSHKTIHVIIKK